MPFRTLGASELSIKPTVNKVDVLSVYNIDQDGNGQGGSDFDEVLTSLE